MLFVCAAQPALVKSPSIVPADQLLVLFTTAFVAKVDPLVAPVHPACASELHPTRLVPATAAANITFDF